MTLDIAAKNPKVDVIGEYCAEQMRNAMDALTEDLLADYIRNHLQSRGAPVGEA